MTDCKSTNSTSRQPMSGIRILDLGTFIAAPFCATLLGEFGAEVIKVELPNVGDPCRRFGSMTECGDTLAWLNEARNKKSLTLDLRSVEGADILKRLVAVSDVVVENFQVGTLEQWGLGWEVLKAINPRLIMVRISGYGQTGPYATRPGFGRIANAFGGLSFLAGEPDRPPANPGSATLPDYNSGLFGALGALLALRARDSTGRGQVVDIGLYESIFRLLDEVAPAYARFGKIRERMGAGTENVCPHSHYPTKDGRWVAIACTTDKIFARLTKVMKRFDLADPSSLGRIEVRLEKRHEVDQLVGEWTKTLSLAEIVNLCGEGEVPCGPVMSIDQIFDDPQYKARENLLHWTDQRAGEVVVPNVVPKLSDTPGTVRFLGPTLGQDTGRILEELLGFTANQIGVLREKGAI
jgi:crotonobetainyl-CoA:carnitine CoA-transferase CaiB-like acyl-CoA transferase